MTKNNGRPSTYKPEYAAQATKLCNLGATDEDLADFFKVSIRTISNWKSQHAEFLQALKGGKEQADLRVQRSLYQRAIGYTSDAVKIFMQRDSRKPIIVPYREHIPPDTTAAIFWLKNRAPELWRDRQSLEHSGPGGAPIEVVSLSTTDRARALAAFVAKTKAEK